MTSSVIMIQGTGSHVGKSILVCALCRILKQDGYKVAPFKAQNMALNSFVTSDGEEMGRAQVAQAEAAGIEPMVEMNPILLKPTGDCGSQVIIMGKPVGNMTAREYYRKKHEFVSVIKTAYDTLKNQFDIIVIEGAGSPAEINLKDGDIVNMGMAQMASAPVLLVTDIDRGGAFAWIVGTMELLSPDERNLVKGVIFNKFRGDKNILKPGLDMLENRISKPIVGVVPYIRHLSIDDEDSVSLEYAQKKKGDISHNGITDIAVIQLPRISNFTDFSIFHYEKDVKIRFVGRACDIGNPDLLIIPGTKNTIDDLMFLAEQGLSDEIIRLSKQGCMIMGICGGYQMLGQEIRDPNHVESVRESIHGLGLLPVNTTFAREKQTYQVKAFMYGHDRLFCVSDELAGYEIHMGETRCDGSTSLPVPARQTGATPFATIIERAGEKVEIQDGCVSQDGNVIGTYIHGIFDNDEFRFKLIQHLRNKKGQKPSHSHSIEFKRVKDQKYDELADIVRENIDMDMIYKIVTI